MEIRGVDISNWQGAPNWDAVSASVSFAFAKASEGTSYKDVQLERNKAEMRRTGIAHGFYHFAKGGDARQEAEFFVSCIGDLQDGEVVALDWEITYAGDADTWCASWLERVKELTGITPLIYMSESLVSAGWPRVRALNTGLWVAKYGTNNGSPQTPPAIGQWPSLTLWQFTSVGKVTGINGSVDLNTFYGDVATLKKYGKGINGGMVNISQSEYDDLVEWKRKALQELTPALADALNWKNHAINELQPEIDNLKKQLDDNASAQKLSQIKTIVEQQ